MSLQRFLKLLSIYLGAQSLTLKVFRDLPSAPHRVIKKGLGNSTASLKIMFRS